MDSIKTESLKTEVLCEIHNHFIEWVSMGGCPEYVGPTVMVVHFHYTNITYPFKDKIRIQSIYDMDVLEY